MFERINTNSWPISKGPGGDRHVVRLLAIFVCVLLSNVGYAARQRGPYLQNLQANRVTVCWEVARPHTGEVRLFDASGTLVNKAGASTRAVRHEVTIQGLVPGRVYSYEVVDGEGQALLGKGSFRSVPGRGEPVSFVAWGDTRKGDKICATLARQIMKTGAGMCVHTGDLVSDGKRMDQWDRYLFGPCAGLLRNMVLWPALGNHDTGTMPDGKTGVFEHVFSLPGKESFYSFDYGDVHFLVLDSTSSLDEQLAFAERDLKAADAAWKCVVVHHPPFSSSHHPSHVQLRAKILPVLAKNSVDMLIAGHNHHFMLSKPIRHVYESKQKHPYVQLVTGGGGAYPADFEEDDRWFDMALKAFHFVLIRIEGNTLSAQVYDQNGRVLKRFEMDRTRPVQNAVAFELIEMERYLAELKITNTNLSGWPTGLVIPAEEYSGQLVYPMTNPLPQPVVLRMEYAVSAGLVFEPRVQEVELQGGESTEVRAPFRVTSPESLYPITGPRVVFESPLGSGEVQMASPPIVLGRALVADRIADGPVVDGRGGDVAWLRATSHGRFVRWAADNLSFQSAKDESSVQALNDGTHLYLLLRRPLSRPVDGGEGRFSDDDHFSIYLASESKALGIRMYVDGRHKNEGTRGLADDVVVAQSRDDNTIVWEVGIGLDAFREDLSRPGQPLWFNVMEGRGQEFFTFSPTFRQHPSRANSAELLLQ